MCLNLHSRLISRRGTGCRIAVCLCLAFLGAPQGVSAADRETQEPGWIPIVFAPSELQERIDATPIEQRPYRPLHVYGNTVRRVYYRGTPMPRFRELIALPVRVAIRPRDANSLNLPVTTQCPPNAR